MTMASSSSETQRVAAMNAFVRKPIPSPLQVESQQQHQNHRRRPRSASNPLLMIRSSSHFSYNSINNEKQQGHQQGGTTTTSFTPNDTTSPIINTSNSNTSLHRHLSLLDLILVGIGGTVGSGLFVLAGLVAHRYAGPSAILSWAVAGAAACLSGCCYAELSARIPLPGSAYIYSHVAMGEYAAVVAASCLSLEYIFASSAVSRSWGDKMAVWLVEQEFVSGSSYWHDCFQSMADGSSWFNPLAFCMAAGTVALLLSGVKESKRATNFITSLKISIVVFMVSVSVWHIQPKNWTPFWVHGASGVFRGSTTVFFGYLGYDQLCGMAGEAKNPKRDLPLATLVTLVTVAVIYMISTLALTGLLPSDQISTVSGFPSAFFSLDLQFAAQVTALGELVTLPIVVLITTQVQARLFYAMAEDALLPKWFCQLDSRGNLWNGTLVAGCIMTFVATVVPFTHLNDVISCAALAALTLTDTSLLCLWYCANDNDAHSSPTTSSSATTTAPPLFFASSSSSRVHCLLLAFHASAFGTSMVLTRMADSASGRIAAAIGTACMIVSVLAISCCCSRSNVFGGHRGGRAGFDLHDEHEQYHQEDTNALLLSSPQPLPSKNDDGYFRTPFLPFWPCTAIFINYYLIAQLELMGIFGFLFIVLIASLYYFWFTGQQHQHQQRHQVRHRTRHSSSNVTKSNSNPELLRRRHSSQTGLQAKSDDSSDDESSVESAQHHHEQELIITRSSSSGIL